MQCADQPYLQENSHDMLGFTFQKQMIEHLPQRLTISHKVSSADLGFLVKGVKSEELE